VKYRVQFAPEAVDQLQALHAYIATSAAPDIASAYLDAVVTYCEGLAVFPHRGTQRDDIRPGLRITAYRKRTIIAFAVDDPKKQVTILGVFHGGQDYESTLAEDSE
jgi:toxin ParE1/3/4